MPNRLLLSRIPLLTVAFLGLAALPQQQALAAQLQTPEIVFTGSDAAPLAAKAGQLGTAVAIYEYVHNNFEFSTYHGSRSGSVNTFNAQRGSDVDIATALIAMMRARNIPARYAVATVRMPAAQFTNWLGIANLDVAVQVLKDQGIQKVALAADRSTVDFEHVWSEVLVPFEQYRGLTLPSTVDCSLASYAARCDWVPLDGSFKQKTYNGLNIDPYSALSFDYTGYYNAIKNSATDTLLRKDKNPLTILEEQIGTWLRANKPGNTLEDVADAGQIIEIHDGLLPASLPFKVVGGIGSVRHYDSVASHDTAAVGTEAKDWGKRLSITVGIVAPLTGGGTFTATLGAGNPLLAELNTKRLTLATEFPPPGNIPNVVTRLGGVEIARPLGGSGTIVGYNPKVGDAYTIYVSMDGTPDPTGGTDDNTVSATYYGILGGYYLIATGGESSNWQQVHNAANQLLTANDTYKIVFNPNESGCDKASGLNCTPFVDATKNGWDSSDPTLLDNKPALDALTGGLLYVAATQYYTKVREQFQRADLLMKAKTPIVGFLGIVSSTHEAEYIDGTAFSILPGGLLIDMKGITIAGSYRTNDTPLTYSNRQFEFLGHITSSLEHETWQELTGYDAVSTVRGIQMALSNGATLLNPKKNATADTLPGLYGALGFSIGNPATAFTYSPFTIGTTAPATWKHATNGSTFDLFQATIGQNTSDLRKSYGQYSYTPNSGLYGWSKCVSDQISSINASPEGSYTGTTCDGTAISGSKADLLNGINNDWKNTIIPQMIGQKYFDYFDTKHTPDPFDKSLYVYRTAPPANDAQETTNIANIRSNLYDRDLSKSWAEYLIPSKLTIGTTYRFTVDIHKEYSTADNRLTSMAFEINNLTK
ncbi:transglutaminase-like domain-containing protein [Methylovulum psychrotolerans]|uniref:Transglutaminase-like domain-containing protein n=1 Tax=Methylovulum psychrotolerans TaxID=1704499 RepID=A0A2S5CJK7_9GAMM|nr:transglutaminase domain-containing protein [Methylovulum psychrotolerans]POZ50995.1 hypothetical protein AADEFJLK_02949 [Methylovulum psychrotolerans]